MKKISLCLTTFNRYELLIQSFEQVIDDERISEIIINDDASTDGSYEKLVKHFKGVEKIKLFRNEFNLDCYFNKRASVKHATNEFVILFDSDNILTTDYLDKIYSVEWEEDVIIAPCFARPHFNYRAYSGLMITKKNVAAYISMPLFSSLLNTCNFFINRAEYLRCWNGSLDPVTADTIYFNYSWLNAGNRIYVMPDLEYDHFVHSDSHYKKNVHRTGNLNEQIENKLKQMA